MTIFFSCLFVKIFILNQLWLFSLVCFVSSNISYIVCLRQIFHGVRLNVAAALSGLLTKIKLFLCVVIEMCTGNFFM